MSIGLFQIKPSSTDVEVLRPRSLNRIEMGVYLDPDQGRVHLIFPLSQTVSVVWGSRFEEEIEESSSFGERTFVHGFDGEIVVQNVPFNQLRQCINDINNAANKANAKLVEIEKSLYQEANQDGQNSKVEEELRRLLG